MLVDRQIPSLYNGVSQQPDATRLPSQAETQINFYGTVVDGLRRRPPTEHVAKLTAEDLSSSKLHLINRDVTERFVLVLSPGSLRVFDLAGNEKTVTFPGRAEFQASHAYSNIGETIKPAGTPAGVLYKVTDVGTSGGSAPAWPTTLGDTVASGGVIFTAVPDYLSCSNAKLDFSCVTVADYTFIVNRTRTVGLDAVGMDLYEDPESYYWMNRWGGYDEPYYDVVGRAIQRSYQANYAPASPSYTVVQTLQDLPDAPSEGALYYIQGNDENSFSGYWVVRQGSAWNETVQPQLQNKLDACSMPHALVRKANGDFEFSPFSWNPRRVGDEKTNRHPSFVGRQIRDVFFYKNRLGFAVNEGIVLSRAGDFGTFHRLTVVDLLPDEVIDAAASSTKVTLINHAVPFDTGMMLFADQVQYRVTHGDVLTPTTVSPDVATQYEMVTTVRPCPMGSDVYFASEDGDWAKVYEYYVRDESSSTDAGDVTGHVPRYIPSGVTKLAGSTKQDVLVVLTNGAINATFVYKFYWASETEKAQSSWSAWVFSESDTILDCEVLDNSLFYITHRADGTYLDKMQLESGARAPGLTLQVFLDRRVSVTGVWLSLGGYTEFTLPYDVAVADRPHFRIVRGASFGAAKGALLATENYSWAAANVVRVVGNFGGACYAGLRYESRYTFSKPFMRNQNDVAITSGSLTLIGYTVSFTETAYFRTEVAPYGVEPDVEEIIPSRISEFDGKTLGEAHLIVGTPVLSKGSFAFQVHGEADVATVSLVNDSPYASTFTQCEWEGNWDKLSRTV